MTLPDGLRRGRAVAAGALRGDRGALRGRRPARCALGVRPQAGRPVDPRERHRRPAGAVPPGDHPRRVLLLDRDERGGRGLRPRGRAPPAPSATTTAPGASPAPRCGPAAPTSTTPRSSWPAATPTRSRHAGLSQYVVDLRAPEVEAEPIHLLTGEHRFNATHLRGVPGEPLGRRGRGLGAGDRRARPGAQRPRAVPLDVPAARGGGRRRGRTSTTASGWPVGGLVAKLAALRRLSLGVASALERGGSPDVAAALVKDLGTRYEGDVVHAARTLSPVAADAGCTGGLGRRAARARHHAPARLHAARRSTDGILRGIITKGLPRRGGARPGSGARRPTPRSRSS